MTLISQGFITEKVHFLLSVLLVGQQDFRDVHLWVGCVSSQVPSQDCDLDFLLDFVLGLKLSHLLLQNALGSIRCLANVLVEEYFDRFELFVVVEVVLDVPLNPGHHLLELSSETLLSLLDDPCDVAVGPCVLLR